MSNQAHDNAGRLLILAHELKMARIMPIDSEVSAEPRATVPHACPSADEWCVPLSLRIVAFAFILVGTLSVVEMLLGWFVFSQIRIDFLFVGIFIGRGLLKWRESSRGWALFFTWLTLALISFWFAMAGYVVLGGQLPRGTWVGGASAYGLIAGTCIFAYLIWQLRTLRRTDIVTRFRNARLKHVLSNEGISQPVRRGRWQFSISSLMLATVVMAFVLVRLTSDDLLYDTQHVRSSRRVGNSIHGLEYGVRSYRFLNQPDELIYAVLSSGKDRWHGHVNRAYGTSVTSIDGTEILLPRGKRIDLPGEYQLYEVSNGRLRVRKERVTKAELEDYFTSNPDEWGIDALVEHTEQLRTRRNK